MANRSSPKSARTTGRWTEEESPNKTKHERHRNGRFGENFREEFNITDETSEYSASGRGGYEDLDQEINNEAKEKSRLRR